MNAAVLLFLLAGGLAIRSGRQRLHMQFMVSMVVSGLLFVVGYVTQTLVADHGRFPGDDWVRTAFLVILVSHEILALVVLPLILRTLYFASKKRFDRHKKIARWTFVILTYVASTGLVVYWMNNHLRPHGP